MDGVSRKIEISVDDLVSTVDDHSQSWQLLLRVVSHIRILIDGEEFYEESEFPIVEFCAQAAALANCRRGVFPLRINGIR
jgi:hypothetical protein